MSYLVFKNYGTVREEMLGEYSDYGSAVEHAEREAEDSYWDDLIEVSDYDETGEYRVHRDWFGKIREQTPTYDTWEY